MLIYAHNPSAGEASRDHLFKIKTLSQRQTVINK